MNMSYRAMTHGTHKQRWGPADHSLHS